MSEAKFSLRLFSTPELRERGSEASLLPAGKPMAVLVFLAAEGRPVARQELAELLWPGADPARGKASVRQALWNLRKRLGADLFASENPLALAPGRVKTDLEEYRAVLETGDLARARDLWGGALLEGLEFPRTPGWTRWIDELRTREEGRLGNALTTAAAEARASGDLRKARGLLEWAVEVRPYQASLHVSLVETLLESRSLRSAGEALLNARRALTDSEEVVLLDELEARLSSFRGTANGEVDTLSIRTEFVGRTSEFSSLATAWRRAKGGRAELAMILGGPGIGKTRLAQETAALVRSEGLSAVTVKAVEVERSLRWGTAGEMVRALHVLPGAAGISNRSTSVLARLVPSLGGFSPEKHGSSPGRAEPAAVADALLDLVSAVAEESPLLLFVDDLQWVDRESRAALSHLVRNLKREPVLFLITCRTGEGDPEVAKAVESLQRAEEAQTLELGPLGAHEVSELLALLLSGVEPQKLDTLAERLYGVTQGNPLFVIEVLKLLHDQGLMEPDGQGKWAVDPSCLEGRLPVPETVESAILRRLEDLGDHAQLLAAHLARQARPLPAEEMARLAGLDPFQISEGVAELFDRDLVKREAQNRIQFVHDAVTEVARAHLRPPAGVGEGGRLPPRREGGDWIPWILLAATVAALFLAGFGGVGPLGMLGGGSAGSSTAQGPVMDQTHPYGQGRIFGRVMGEPRGYWLRPPSEVRGEWEVKDTVLETGHPGLHGPFRTSSDSLIWFVRHSDGPDGPPYVGKMGPDNTIRPFWRIQGDVGFRDLSPDGATLLIMQQNLEAPTYAHDLVSVDQASERGRILFRAPDKITSAKWAPDGLKIALVAVAWEDSIHIVDPRGGRLGTFGVPGVRDIFRLNWCADSERLTFNGFADNRRRTGILDLGTGQIEFPDAEIHGPAAPLCLGNGRALAYWGSWMEEAALLLLDLETGVHTPLLRPTQGVRLDQVRWVPDAAHPTIQGIDIQPGEPRVDWGRRTTLSAMGRYSDGTIQPVEVRWEALDPSRASVDPRGVVTGNQAGPAPVVAHYANWMRDTVMVHVREWERPDVTLRENFEAEDLAEWSQFGSPPSRIVEVDGETVLSLEGDGRFWDGLISKSEFSLDQGSRVELVFRLPLSQPDRQRIDFCIQPANLEGPAGDLAYLGSSTEFAYCLRYPARELVKFDPSQLVAYYPTLGSRDYIRLPADLDTSQWTQLALEVQPDGQIAFFLNQRLVRALRPPLVIEPGTRWRIQLAGAAENTNLHVRSVTVYSGGPDDDEPEANGSGA